MHLVVSMGSGVDADVRIAAVIPRPVRVTDGSRQDTDGKMTRLSFNRRFHDLYSFPSSSEYFSPHAFFVQVSFRLSCVFWIQRQDMADLVVKNP
jgi:hypothetical protein